MARARNIKPSICLNDVLAGLDHWIRLLFIYLWTMADRSGRLEDNPKRIGAALFPYEPELPFDEGLKRLHDGGFICRYVVDGGRFIQVVNWGKHQHPHHKEVESVIPEHPALGLPGAFPGLAPVLPQSSRGYIPVLPQSSPSDSGFLIPDSLSLDSHARAGDQSANRLGEFLDAYPKRTKAEAAAKAYASTISTSQEHGDLMAGLARWLDSDQWRRSLAADGGRYVPDPDKFILGRRYLETPVQFREGVAGGESDALTAAMEILAQQKGAA